MGSLAPRKRPHERKLAIAEYAVIQILIFIFPPIALLFRRIPGRNHHRDINYSILWTLCGWVPGIIHASMYLYDSENIDNKEPRFFHLPKKHQVDVFPAEEYAERTKMTRAGATVENASSVVTYDSTLDCAECRRLCPECRAADEEAARHTEPNSNDHQSRPNNPSAAYHLPSMNVINESRETSVSGPSEPTNDASKLAVSQNDTTSQNRVSQDSSCPPPSNTTRISKHSHTSIHTGHSQQPSTVTISTKKTESTIHKHTSRHLHLGHRPHVEGCLCEQCYDGSRGPVCSRNWYHPKGCKCRQCEPTNWHNLTTPANGDPSAARMTFVGGPGTGISCGAYGH